MFVKSSFYNITISLCVLTTTISATCSSAQKDAASAAITTAAKTPQELAQEAYLLKPEHPLFKRQNNQQGYDYCNGSGGICRLYGSWEWPSCANIDPNSLDWKKCQCETGRLATRFACEDCENFYGLLSGGILSFAQWQEICAADNLSIAPIPSEIVSSWSAYNATQTADTARPTGSISTKRYLSNIDITSRARTSSVSSSDDVEEGAGRTSSMTSSLPVVRTPNVITGTLTFSGVPTGGVPTASTTGAGSPLQSSVGTGGGGTSAASQAGLSAAIVGVVLGLYVLLVL